MGNEIKRIKEAQIELRAVICPLIGADLRELCTELHIELKEKGTGRLAQTVTKLLDAEELDIKKLKELKSCGPAEGGKRIGENG